ncbi:DUF2207 family protein [Knoellia locipacati]|uniref:DUF2207 family protein n=1 Tax=Knoellia locipacati TaxID=882824 RepID=UPI00164BFE15|nr:DUF2207 domain-containing protein [Knoellia locipacati]
MPADVTPLEVLGGLVPLVGAALTLLWFRWRRRDEVFTQVTPGEVPRLGSGDGSARVRRGVEWKGSVAPRFHVPDESTPALSGTVIDGVVHGRDLTATLVDLALRGIVSLEREGDDWRVSRTGIDETSMAAHERVLLDAVLGGSPSVRLGELRKAEVAHRWREAEIAVYRAVVDRGWYAKHPRSRNGWLAALGLVLVLGAAVAGVASGVADDHWRWVPLGVGLGVGGALLVRLGRGRTPRTALGSAARIQALGYEKYLATAEAHQLRREELAGEVRSMLPYAVAFGVAAHVASVLGDALRAARIAEGTETALAMAVDGALDPGVFQLMSGLVDLGGDLDVPDLGALGDLVPDDAFTALVDGFEGLGSALSSFAGSIGDVIPDGDVLDGCDGCGGCIDF